MIGFIDESMRQHDGGLYVLALSLVSERTLDTTRSAVRSAMLQQRHRFHWHTEGESQRYEMLHRLRTATAGTIAYACRPAPAAKQERARALCMNRMLWDLLHRGDVRALLIESRQERNDQRDRLTVVRAQKARRAPIGLRYDFARPSEEPLLWLPDAGAGAVATALSGTDHGYLEALGDSISIVHIVP